MNGDFFVHSCKARWVSSLIASSIDNFQYRLETLLRAITATRGKENAEILLMNV